MNRRVGALLAIVTATVVAAGMAVPGGAAAKFGPKLEQCGKLKKKVAKRACKKRNANTRKAFGEIKNSRFTGTLFNGVTIDATFCASGKWAVALLFTSGNSRDFSGPRWKLSDVYVKPKLLSATATGPSNNIYTRVALQRRGKAWVFARGNASLPAPAATKTAAADHCRTL